MKWIEQKKQQFIRWYYGYFVNDPQAETFSFGLHRSFAAMRLSRNVARVRRHWKWIVLLPVTLILLYVV